MLGLLGGLWRFCADIFFVSDHDFPEQLHKLDSLPLVFPKGVHETCGHVIYGAQLANTLACVFIFSTVLLRDTHT